MDASKDYYKILQIDPSAEPEVIEGAYKRLINKYHPDHNKSANATVKTQQINEAYDVLKDPTRRREYDAARKYNQTSQRRTSSSSANYEAERRRREEAEREAYEARRGQQEAEWKINEARRQAEDERQSAAYERQQRQRAEEAAKRADVTRDIYQSVLHFIKRVGEFFRQNKPVAYVLVVVLIILILIRPVTRTVDFDLQTLILKWSGFEITPTPTEMVPIMKFSTTEPTSISIAQASTITPQASPTTSVIQINDPLSSEDVLFTDGFEDENWTNSTWEGDETKWIIEDESLKFIHNGRAFAGDIYWSDYIFSANVQGVKTIDKSIFFRYTDNWHNYYIFLRSSPINDIVLVKTVPSSPNHIIASASIMNSTSTWYSIKVRAEGSHFQVFVNDKQFIDYYDTNSPLLTGRIGILANLSSASGAAVHFDNIMVTTLGQ